jgi:hypothetical protein
MFLFLTHTTQCVLYQNNSKFETITGVNGFGKSIKRLIGAHRQFGDGAAQVKPHCQLIELNKNPLYVKVIIGVFAQKCRRSTEQINFKRGQVDFFFGK